MLIEKERAMPWWEKYTLTIEEASQYFGIGEKALRRFIKQHKNDDFLIYNGKKVHIKRKIFEQYIDKEVSVI